MNGLMSRRRALMAAQVKPQFLEYIQSTGTQCIDTGYIPTENCGFYIKYRDDVVGNSNYVIGSRASTSGTIYEGVVGGQANQKIMVMQQTLMTADNYRVAGNTYEISATYDSNLTGVSSFECLTTSDSLTGTQDSLTSGATANLFIFSLMKDAQFHTGMTLYSCKLWSNGTLVRDFIPCRLGDSVGLYDLVNEKFYGNSGTGKFVAGPKIDYQFLEYVESTGTQWIDTGVKLSNESNVRIKYQYINGTESSRILGSFIDTESIRWLLTCALSPAVSQVQMGWNKTWSPSSSEDFITPNYDIVEFEAKGQYISGTVNNVHKNYTLPSDTFETLTTASLFGCAGSYSKARIFYCEIDKSRMLLPCKLGSEVGLYDKITNKFFINRGTGSLVAGPEVGYQFVEYLQNSGIPYIDTGISGNNPLTVDIKYEFTEIPGSQTYGWIFGNYIDETHNVTRIIQYTNSVTYVNNNTSASPATKLESVTKQLNTIYHDILTPTKYTSNDISIDIREEIGTENNNNILIFTGKSDLTSGVAKIKLYSFSITNNGTLIQDLLPCYRKLDHEPGMYDLVTGQFFTNQGTGSFIVGPELDYQFVEYIESTGEQYINTDLFGTENTKIELKCNVSSYSDDKVSIFGAYVDENNSYSIYCNSNAVSRVGNAKTYSSIGLAQNYIISINKDALIIGSDSYPLGTSNTFTTSQNLWLFNRNGTTTSGFIGKMYSCKIYDNDVLVRDLIPCYRKSNHTVGMYDLVTKRFFINSGTGKFIAGPEID